MARKNILQQIEEFHSGLYNEAFNEDGLAVNWVDWVCHHTELSNKTKNLYELVIRIVEANRENNNMNFGPEKVCVCFKNCCPEQGNLYDIVCIFAVDHDSDTKEYVITPKSGNTSDNGKANLYIIGEDSIDFDDFNGIVEWFKK